MKRIVWIDYAKSLAIYMVCLIHLHCDYTLTQLTKGIAMPLFFMISGFLFSSQRWQSFRPFLSRRFRQLIIPYLWINAVTYIFWLVVGRNFGDDASACTQWHEPLKGILLGIGPLLIHNIPLWSLVSFFMVEIIYYLTLKVIPRPLPLIPVFLLTAWLSTLFPDVTGTLPLTLGAVGIGLFFYSVGHWARGIQLRASSSPAIRLSTMLLSLALFVICTVSNVQVSFFRCQVGSFPLFIVGALSGCLGFALLSAIIGRWLGERKLIMLISYGTLLICGFHLLVFSLMKGVGVYLLGLSPEAMTKGILAGPLFALVGLFLCLPIVLIVRRYFRPLVDK
ncbi:MAG: acyltransferase family protein [Muribaculaceae bacterium]|nr:acyltransferase family protein [Muribaculaceae bacterium]